MQQVRIPENKEIPLYSYAEQHILVSKLVIHASALYIIYITDPAKYGNPDVYFKWARPPDEIITGPKKRKITMCQIRLQFVGPWQPAGEIQTKLLTFSSLSLSFALSLSLSLPPPNSLAGWLGACMGDAPET
jgi:hypothetical protein